MLFTVLQKGAIYALVAVSMNLLNGFTGLFSLGQAGFMLLGAYTYAILTIPVAAAEHRCISTLRRQSGAVSRLPHGPLALILAAGVVAALFALPHRPAGAAAEERLSGHRHAGLCGDHPRRVPVAASWAR